MKRNVPDERLRESVGEALGAVTFTYSRGEGQESDKVCVQNKVYNLLRLL